MGRDGAQAQTQKLLQKNFAAKKREKRHSWREQAIAAYGHEDTLASKESYRAERPVQRRQPTFMNEHTMAVDRPLLPLGLADEGDRCRSVTGHSPRS
jgi:hypothetical protein